MCLFYLLSQQPYREERVDLDLDWVHDKFEDDRNSALTYEPFRISFPPFLTVASQRVHPAFNGMAPVAIGTLLRLTTRLLEPNFA